MRVQNNRRIFQLVALVVLTCISLSLVVRVGNAGQQVNQIQLQPAQALSASVRTHLAVEGEESTEEKRLREETQQLQQQVLLLERKLNEQQVQQKDQHQSIQRLLLNQQQLESKRAAQEEELNRLRQLEEQKQNEEKRQLEAEQKRQEEEARKVEEEKRLAEEKEKAERDIIRRSQEAELQLLRREAQEQQEEMRRLKERHELEIRQAEMQKLRQQQEQQLQQMQQQQQQQQTQTQVNNAPVVNQAFGGIKTAQQFQPVKVSVDFDWSANKAANKYVNVMEWRPRSTAPPYVYNVDGTGLFPDEEVMAKKKAIAESDIDPVKSSSPTHKKVFIYSMPRSGSSFTGAVFKATPDTTYLFEPFSHFKVPEACNATVQSLDAMHVADVLRESYTCNFTPLEKMQKIQWWLDNGSSANRSTCVAGVNPSKMVVMKEIKSFWSYNVEYMKEALGSGLRFIWLVRDVRGWVSSFTYSQRGSSSLYLTWKFYLNDFYTSYYSQCHSRVAELGLPAEVMNLMTKYQKFLQQRAQPPHMRLAALWTIETLVQHHMLNTHLPNAHYRLNYETLSREPVKTTEEMFKFIGYNELPPQTADFVRESTKSGDPTWRHGIVCNSTKMIDVWKERLDYCQIKQIEYMAKPAFDLLGYEPYVDEKKTLPYSCDLHFLDY